MSSPIDPIALIASHREELGAFCAGHHIRRMALFGSALGPDFNDRSDLDLLVEFEPGRTPGFAFFELEAELTALLGRKVDLQTPSFLSPRFRDRVLQEARLLYAA